ncbi:hypothetical protein BDV26DRAFT_289313 [Aspergillus bertholletiae]|uniref:Uncharacterized protein n=1 Tax=Aspergillus bertholletiae TaxID=1226010 RepID=A0A5N7BIT6_9EURO|nr:hypothetical protein BDV26DRAFT_289313 [Aspergillus bertholletiae]
MSKLTKLFKIIRIFTDSHSGDHVYPNPDEAVTAIRAALSEPGIHKIRLLPVPRIFPPPYFFEVSTDKPLDEGSLKKTVEEGWKNFVTEDGQKYAPASKIEVHREDDD